ncbi:hypothetical protein MUK42_10408 [Musa troglodytarum]|uniref:RRM domain-containing protein n=1 Tax=Musa troglodytarum TaxID=320322 RepID=A0A9E7KJP0_9LILI|nr:hypothetical protein MUK42_10408 [Musa troglodytarum]
MPPKKRVVKTVRKTVPKSKSKTPVAPAPAPVAAAPADDNPSPPPAASDIPITPVPAVAAEVSTPLPSSTASETPVSELVEPSPEPPAPVAAPEPSEAPSAALPEAVPETSEPSATDASPAVEETQVAVAVPSEAPKKTIVRVRKVIKKKIIKKRIPKVVSSAKKDSLQPPTEAADLETPVTESGLENPSSDAAVGGATPTENVGLEEQKDVGLVEETDVPLQDKEERQEEAVTTAADEEAGMSERQNRRKTEIFIGGLGRDVREEDLRMVFGKVGEIVEVRMMMDGQTGKNKGYAFLRYKEAAQAKRAVSEFSKVESQQQKEKWSHRRWNVGKERAVVMEKFSDGGSGGEVADGNSSDRESFGRRQWQRRKLWTATLWAEEALDVFVDGRGSCGPFPYRWKKLHTEAMTMEVVAVHEGSGRTKDHSSYMFILTRTKRIVVVHNGLVEWVALYCAKTLKGLVGSQPEFCDASLVPNGVRETPKVCGKICGAAALEGNDTIFLGNIDKKWRKEDVIKMLQDIGIEKIDTVTVMADPYNADTNRGFAFLELETNRDAHLAYRKLQKKDVFGKGRNIKVAWAEPLNDPDEEQMQKVKSVYVEGIPSSWHETKLREIFKKFGEIERIVHSRDIQSAKRKDFAFVNYSTRESALSCIESFEKEELTENGSKVNIKVSLAKPVQKGKQNKGFLKSTSTEKDKLKPVQRQVKASVSSYKGKSSERDHNASGEDKKTSTTNELLQVLREQAAWKQGQVGYARGPAVQDYSHIAAGGKRAFSYTGEDAAYSDVRGYPRARLDSSFPVSSSSYGAHPHGLPGSSLPYYQHPSVLAMGWQNIQAPSRGKEFLLHMEAVCIPDTHENWNVSLHHLFQPGTPHAVHQNIPTLVLKYDVSWQVLIGCH